MKKILFLFVLVILTNFVQAQISDEEAKQAYQDAEDQYEAGNYYKCYQMCNDLIVKMGKPNPRILYLDLKAIYNNLERINDKSEYSLKKNYKNYTKFSSYADDFFSTVDKNTYPADKYNEIVEIQKYLNAGMKQYEYEKDRKPEDAINFLNDCAQKFAYKNHDTQYLNYWTGDCNFKFSLDSCYLKVEVLATLTGEKPKDNMVGRKRLIIDLSKVWIEYSDEKYQWQYTRYFYWLFGLSDLLDVMERHASLAKDDNNAPMIVGPKSYINGIAVYDGILWSINSHYNKSMEYDIQQFEKDTKAYGNQKLPIGVYLYELFDQNSDEFKDGNYRQRILDAFEFLIDYYGGGTPTQNKQENKTKF